MDSEDIEAYVDYAEDIVENQKKAMEEAKILSKLSDLEFLKYILENGNMYKMDHLVPRGKFKAYEIAQNCYNRRQLSHKQRLSIANVYIFVESKYYRYTEVIKYI